MIFVVDIVALLIVTPFIALLVAVPVACWRERHLTRAERRTADAAARDSAASDTAGYITRPDWGSSRPRPQLPEKETP